MGLNQIISNVLIGLTVALLACQSPAIPIAEPSRNINSPVTPTTNWNKLPTFESLAQPLPGGYTRGSDASQPGELIVYLKSLDGVAPTREQWVFNYDTYNWKQKEKAGSMRFNPVEFTLFDQTGRAEFFSGLGYYYRPQQAQPFQYLSDLFGQPKRGQLPLYPGAKQPTRFFVLGESVFVLEAGGQNNLWEYDDDQPSTGFQPRPRLPLTGQTDLQTFAIGKQAGYVLVEGNTVRLFQYDPAADRWLRRADFPGAGRVRGVAFSLEGRGYYGAGQNIDKPGGLRDIWQYNPITDTWRRATEYPGGGQTDLVGHVLRDRAFIGLGYGIEPTKIGTNAYEAQYDLWFYTPD